MKKLLCLIFAISMLSCIAFATTSNVSFNEPSEETLAKIEDAIIADGMITFYKCHYSNPNYIHSPAKEVNWVNVIADVNGNYVISYESDKNAIDGCTDIVLGDYMIDYYTYCYAVYSSELDKLLSYPEAYEAGILNNDVFYEIWKHYEKPDQPMISNITRIGDITRDGVIDIVDVAKCRNSIVNTPVSVYSHEFLLSDTNYDKSVDIIDVVIMRDMIVNG